VNLDSIIGVDGLQQDDWSLEGHCFGSCMQLSVIGHDGGKRNKKYYILKCSECAKDSDLFGEGYFKCVKAHLLIGRIPCGCAKGYIRTETQQSLLCKRAAEKLGYKFIGFVDGFTGSHSKIRMLCDSHGEWQTGSVSNLINNNRGCPSCKVEMLAASFRKDDDTMRESFLKSGRFHPDTTFWRSERLTNQGYAAFWFMSCPECGEVGEATGINLQYGKRPCGCSVNRQQECYINIIMDSTVPIAIKFGRAIDSRIRVKSQNRTSVYEVVQHSAYKFSSIKECKLSERFCKVSLECSILSRQEMPDGWTETTWLYNIDKIIEIYERNGGVKIE